MKKRITYYAWLIGCAAVLVLLDQGVKQWALTRLAGQPSIVWIPNVFQLSYVENRGAAFGLLQGNTVLLAVFSIILIGLLLYTYSRIPLGKEGRLLRAVYILIVAGAIGNQIDRVFRGYVVDMFDFCLIRFPVFNVADCCVVIGAGLLILSVLLQRETIEKFLNQGKAHE